MSSTTPSSSPPSNENIVVAVRVRPFTRQEVERGEAVSAFEIQPATRTLIQRLTSQASKKSRIPIASSSSSSSIAPAASTPHTPLHFSCDRLFCSDDSTAAVYDGCMRDIVDSALQGVNGTVFAYGQTASGKTHTMKGSPDHPGLLPLSIRHVFRAILARIDEKWLLRVSYLEIYNERIRDLLHPQSDNLPIHHSKALGAHVEPREVVVRSEEEVLALLEEGERHRHYGQTLMNDFSSRSHTIFRLIIENKPQPPASSQPSPPTSPSPTPSTSYLPPAPRRREKVRVSVLNFVDLAGSERHSQTQTTGSRLREALFINKSLLCLGLCIAKLGEGKGAGGEVPYRDSKLTHLLSGSLGGNSRVVVLCCIGPAVCNSEHSVGTLRFGGRCARVRQQARVNEVSGDDAEINRYEGKIRQLQTRLSVLPAPTPLPLSPPEEAKEAREVGEERRLLAEDRLRVEEERVRLERQIESFKDLIMTATTPGTAPSQAASAVRRRRATFGDGRSSGEWGKGVDTEREAGQGTLSESQEEFFRGQQREKKVASLEAKVERLEGLLKELSAENSALMRDNESTEEDAEALTQRMQELLKERDALQAQLQAEAALRRRWQEAEGVDALSDAALDDMRRGLEAVRARVERQVLWREFCKARDGDDAGADEAGRMERERALREEVVALRARTAADEAQRAEEESARRVAVEEAAAERQRLQSEAEEQTGQAQALRAELRAQEGRAAELDGAVAQWEGRCQALEAECRRVKEENADYSRRLLDVIRPAAVAPQLRLAREASAEVGAVMTYVGYAPASPRVQAASAPPTPMMSAHVPSSAVQAVAPPSLSLDDLMAQHTGGGGQMVHRSASPLPLQDVTGYVGNAVQASPVRVASPVPFRSPSPFQLPVSAGKSAGKGMQFGSAGKRPPVSQTRRK